MVPSSGRRKSTAHGIELKKKYGQHFLRDQSVVEHMLDYVEIDGASVFEIGPGDGFLTRAILTRPITRLWAFEIDHEWAAYLRNAIIDERLTVFEENFLDIDFQQFQNHAPWTVLANLPYQVTFPILYSFQRQRALIKEGIVMVQEEVAQKIVKTSGRGYGFPSLFLQYYFDWKLLKKISPGSFQPPPKVDSRLIYFKPKASVKPIADEQKFWKFIKLCLQFPRRTLRNNLSSTHYDLSRIDSEMLKLRAQQMSMDDFIVLWNQVC